MVLPSHEVYCQLLSERYKGYPLWHPEPPKTGEVQLGDVGYIDEGRVCRIFNAILPADHPINASPCKIPDGHEPFVVPDLMHHSVAQAIGPGPLASKTVSIINGSVGIQAGPAAPASGRIQFQCLDEQAAVLYLEHGADKETLHQGSSMTNYIARNHAKWYEHASTYIDLKEQDIIFVCGFYKTSKWAVAAVTSGARECEIAFGAGCGPYAEAGFSFSAKNQVYMTPETRAGPPPVRDQTGDLPFNQCVFLSFYKCKSRLLRSPKIIRAAAGDPESGDSEEDPPESELLLLPDSETVLETVPAYHKFSDPVDVVLDYVLENSNADLAVASFDEVSELFSRHGVEMSGDILGNLRAISPRISVDEAGVGTIDFQDDLPHSPANLPSEEAAAEVTRMLKEVAVKDDSPHLRWKPLRVSTDEDNINTVAFMPDNIHLVSGSKDGAIRLWNSMTLECITTFPGRHEPVDAVACTPDGRFVASCDAAGVAVWDIAAGALHWAFVRKYRWQGTVAFSPDSSQVAAGSDDGTVQVWNVTGEIICTMSGHTGGINAVAFSPHGQVLASGSHDKSIKIWDISAGKVTHDLRGHASLVTSVAFSPDGSRVASGSRDHTVRIWDAATGEAVRALDVHGDTFTFVAFTSHGSQILSGSDDGTIRKWDASTGDRISTFTISDGKTSRSCISWDDTRIVSASGGTIGIWDARSVSRELVGHEKAVSAVTFAPHGRIFATSSYDKTVRVWNTEKAALVHTIPHDFGVDTVQFSPDGGILATGSEDATVRLFETGMWKEAGSLTSAHAIAFSEDGSCIAGGSSASISVWDVSSLECIHTFHAPEHDPYVLAFSPDMTRIASSDLKDTNLRIWSVDTGECVTELPRPRYPIHSFAFPSDGGHIVSRGYDGSVSVGTIPSLTLHDDSPVDIDEAPLRFSWNPDSRGEGSDGWLHIATGAGRESKPVCWFPKERRPQYSRPGYAWHGDIVVVGSEDGWITILDLTDAARSL